LTRTGNTQAHQTLASTFRSPRRVAAVVIRCLLSLAMAFALLLLPACGGDSSSTAEAKQPKKSAPRLGGSKATGADFVMPKEIVIPTVADSGSISTIDTSGVANGYVGARATSPSRLKFQVVCGEMTYNYDMPNGGSAMCFPINMGNGGYQFRIMENIEGSSYAELDSASADITLSSEFAPFLVPNIYCNYTTESKCVKKAKDLMKSVSNQGEAVREICTWVAKNVTYDYDKAEVLAQSSGYIPDADDTLKTGTGICFDYACLSAAMLRSLGLPAQVVTGYVGEDQLYHAWTMVYVDGTWQTADFSIKPKSWSRCDVTFASAGAGAVTGDGTTYTDRFIF